jgi:S1/P1 Nuclease
LLQRPVCVLLWCLLGAGATWPPLAQAWGDEGHEIVALIAQHYLDAPVRARMQALLASDASALVPDTSMASEATWADRYRDSDRDSRCSRYRQTRQWHYVDIELDAPNLDRACFDHPLLPPGTPASAGPPAACVVDKIGQFAAELADAHTSSEERLLALQFLLHLVGDVHQPLHAADDADEGGNRKRVSARGLHAGSLHHYWDTEFVRELGAEALPVSQQLIAGISAADLKAWQRGAPADWARESLTLAKARAYDPLPSPSARGTDRLSATYVSDAVSTVRLQLCRAGVRLAMMLNRALR